MPSLREPAWRSLRIGDVREFWEQHRDWENRLDPTILAALIQRHQRDRLDALRQLQLDRIEQLLATDAWRRGQGS